MAKKKLERPALADVEVVYHGSCTAGAAYTVEIDGQEVADVYREFDPRRRGGRHGERADTWTLEFTFGAVARGMVAGNGHRMPIEFSGRSKAGALETVRRVVLLNPRRYGLHFERNDGTQGIIYVRSLDAAFRAEHRLQPRGLCVTRYGPVLYRKGSYSDEDGKAQVYPLAADGRHNIPVPVSA